MVSGRNELHPKEKWRLLLSDEGACPMVSPICDDWSLDIPYYWPYEGPDPFPPGHRRHTLSQQMAMAKICGWDAMLISGIDFLPKDESLLPSVKTYESQGRVVTETHIATPYGELSNIVARNESSCVIKEWLISEEDYKKAIWLSGQIADYDEDAAIRQGQEITRIIDGKGVFGTWVDIPVVLYCNIADVFYHCADWPDSFEELHHLTNELLIKRLDTLRKAGLDYIFCAVAGSEWSSPGFFRKWTLDPAGKIIDKWRNLGGFTVWHTCGHAARFIEEGFYNQLRPEIFETLSEKPEGNIPSIRWARERLDKRIVTKGNVRLDTLLRGTEDDVRAAVRRVREETKGYRHIVGTGDDILHNTPLANARAFAEEAIRQQ